MEVLICSQASPVVVVDTRFLSELKDLPDDHISFSEAMNEVILTILICELAVAGTRVLTT